MQCRHHHPIHKSKVSPRDNWWRLELHLGDAFKKGMTLKASPSPALANTKSKISLGSAPETSSQQPAHRAGHLQNPHRRPSRTPHLHQTRTGGKRTDPSSISEAAAPRGDNTRSMACSSLHVDGRNTTNITP
jgi:hypothetical protein